MTNETTMADETTMMADVADVAVLLDEFSVEQHERLVRLRRAVAGGERSDYFPIDKRQDFIRWLIDQGKLSDN
ncbi:MAG: hypothetical protein HY332_15945 [Chloroflexi bacterium]|nr:hypothetical protein [Chloroflexota bacterium]